MKEDDVRFKRTSHKKIEGCGERCARSMMCITCKHERADQDNDQERSASLDATRRTHSKTFHRASRQRFVSGARGRGICVPAAGDAQAWTERDSTIHADWSTSIRVTEPRVPTEHQAPSCDDCGKQGARTRSLGESRRDCSPDAEIRVCRQVRTRHGPRRTVATPRWRCSQQWVISGMALQPMPQ